MRKFIVQKFIGLIFVALSILFIGFAAIGHEDCGAGVLIGFLGLYLIGTRRIVLG
jgi:hypothetical protein